MRIDAHQHFWKYDPVRDAWIDTTMGALRRDFLPDDAAPLLRAAGIDGVVAVQADQSEAETDFLLALAEGHPFIKGVVGWVDLRATDLVERLVRWQQSPRLKGFRHIAQAEADDFLAGDDIARGVAILGEHDYSYDILVYAPQLPAAVQLVARTPGVRFILDHCAKPSIATGEIRQWRAQMQRLGGHEHLWCKLSGLVTEAHWQRWTEADLTPYLDVALELFGPRRLLFGSDWPVCLLAAEYGRVLEVVERWAMRLSAEERGAIFGGNARVAYRLEE